MKLDLHSQAILEEYRSLRPVFEDMERVIPGKIKEFFDEAGILVAALEHRVKTEESLKGKLALKGSKYHDLFDLTCLR